MASEKNSKKACSEENYQECARSADVDTLFAEWRLYGCFNLSFLHYYLIFLFFYSIKIEFILSSFFSRDLSVQIEIMRVKNRIKKIISNEIFHVQLVADFTLVKIFSPWGKIKNQNKDTPDVSFDLDFYWVNKSLK